MSPSAKRMVDCYVSVRSQGKEPPPPSPFSLCEPAIPCRPTSEARNITVHKPRTGTDLGVQQRRHHQFVRHVPQYLPAAAVLERRFDRRKVGRRQRGTRPGGQGFLVAEDSFRHLRAVSRGNRFRSYVVVTSFGLDACNQPRCFDCDAKLQQEQEDNNKDIEAISSRSRSDAGVTQDQRSCTKRRRIRTKVSTTA